MNRHTNRGIVLPARHRDGNDKKDKSQFTVYRQAALKGALEGMNTKKPIHGMSSHVTSESRRWAQYYADIMARFIMITDLTRDRILLKDNSIQHINLPDKAEGKRSRLLGSDVFFYH